jgi:molecular chaperone GrpE
VTQNPDEQDRVIIRDNRKIDPVTGEARKPEPKDDGTGGESSALAPESAEAPMVEASLLDERTRDLQRVQAEYANYRKRADRDRLAAGEIATGRVLAELLPILDDLDRAREHGDLTGALKAIADKLDGVTGKLGLQAFGEEGEPFDPTVHEAVMHDESAEVSEPTCTKVLRKGYKHGERLLRPAMVGVTDPSGPVEQLVEQPTPPPAPETQSQPETQADVQADAAEPQPEAQPDDEQ